MTAVVTRAAVTTFFACVGLALLSFAMRSPTGLSLAGGLLIGLAAAWALTLPMVQRLRSDRLELACRVGPMESSALASTVVPGMPFRIVCTFRHRAARSLKLTHMVAILPNDVTLLAPPPVALWAPPGERNEMSFTLVANAAGRVVMQGIAVNVPGPFGLFEAPLYFPHPLVVKVVPRAAAIRGGRQDSMQGLAVERSGRTVLRRHGGGTELRELRELQPGDPFKSIAWKPSARAGRLLVREAEREVQRTMSVVIDVSGSMRGGQPGHRKLDFALELAAVEARRGLDRGDRVGLITVDGRVLAHVPPDDGVRHLIPIYDGLLSATEVVDLDLTDVDDDEVVALVGHYLRQQDAVDYSTTEGWQRTALIAHAARALLSEPEPRPAIVAGDPGASMLRRFCRQRGIPLRYRADTRADGKGVGLARALRLAGGDTRMPRLITVVTDFDGVPSLDVLRRSLLLLKRMHHDIIFVFPEAALAETAGQASQGSVDATREVIAVYRMHEERRAREAKEFLGKLGIPLVFAGAGATPATAAARAGRVRKVA